MDDFSYPDHIEPDLFFAESEDYVPTTIMFVQTVMKHECSQALTVLFDPGSKYTYFNETALPHGATPLLLDKAEYPSTAGGHFKVTRAVNLSSLSFPEFSKSLKYDSIQARLFRQPSCRYDVIIGRDFLNEAKLDLCFSDGNMRWSDRVVPMKKASEPFALFIDLLMG